MKLTTNKIRRQAGMLTPQIPHNMWSYRDHSDITCARKAPLDSNYYKQKSGVYPKDLEMGDIRRQVL